jgi:predicted flap endonuclease-1-like 5' DNA nuclease
MGSLGCCFVWFLVGALLGWLLNYWLCKRCCKKTKENIKDNSAPSVAKAANVPTASVASEKKVAAKPKTTTTTEAKATIDLAAAKAAGIKIKNAEDLTVIEGVGPKISELFKDGGLKTFTQVGGATVKEMRAILDKGGARYRMANPGTWAKQAKLAANNKWKELKKLQDELSGGKKK